MGSKEARELLEIYGKLSFESQPVPAPWRDEGFTHVQRFTLSLGDNDVVLVR